MKRKKLFCFAIILLVLALLHTSIFSRHFTLRHKISLNRYRVTLKKGEKFHLTAYTLSFVTFKSENFRIASVTPGGTIYAHQKGTTYICVTAGKDSDWCLVKVK